MCTIAVLHRVHPHYPVVLAANRDEYYARTTTGPQVLVEMPRAVGGRDEERGGTWLGVTATGMIVALTNQRTHSAPQAARRSRGHLVLELLRAGSVAAARDALAATDARDYNACNLIFGDAAGLFVAYPRGEARPSSAGGVAIEPVPPGVHVLPNDRLDSPDFAKVERLRGPLRGLAAAPWAALAPALGALLADHERPPLAAVPAPPAGSPLTRELLRELQAVCIHTPSYGTRSAALVALAPGRVAHYLHAGGPPCTTPFADATALLAR